MLIKHNLSVNKFFLSKSIFNNPFKITNLYFRKFPLFKSLNDKFKITRIDLLRIYMHFI